ncbi:hypothetical protein AB0M46_29430 [Dactylosporangium sp. NPDC051485]|uniref:hypothetical protein n=1 Tax=Dactylosporangium sp. NPDC051485 TaxID=3154846 RepID=UPI0034372B05
MGEHGFAVDPSAVHGFGRDLQHDLDVHLSAEKIQTLHIFSETPIFGARTASSTVQQAAKSYHARLLALYDVMDAMLYNGAVLARAAHTIADAYAASDMVAGDEVQRAVFNARQATAADAIAVDPRTGRPI